MATAGVPTAAERAPFTDLSPRSAYVDRHAEPLVVKASGLAAGKGAVVCATRAEARGRRPGDARRGIASARPGGPWSIEAFLEGEELSVLALTDGRDVELLPGCPGSQAAARGRHRAQHRRHGRVQPGRAGHAGPARRG